MEAIDPKATLAAIHQAVSEAAKITASSRVAVIYASRSVGNVAAGPVQTCDEPKSNRVGARVTLTTNLLEPKRLELLHKMVPNAKSIAVLVNPAKPLSKHSSEPVRCLVQNQERA